MSVVGEAFIQAYGMPDPSVPCRLRFTRPWDQELMNALLAEFGSGHYRDGFFSLLGEDLVSADALLESWRFILPDEVPRLVVGRNAYGVLLVIEDLEKDGSRSQLCVLDPIRVSYHRDENWRLLNGLVTWLPTHYPNFMNDAIYRAHRAEGGERLRANEILAIKAPTSLGGAFAPDNFQVEDMFTYFAQTAVIYQEALRTQRGQVL